MKTAIILEHAPARIAESLRLSGPDVRDNYPAMRDDMRCLYESTREYSPTQTYTASLINGNDSTPMDVSAVFYGKGKKGKGKKGKDKEGHDQGRQDRQGQADHGELRWRVRLLRQVGPQAPGLQEEDLRREGQGQGNGCQRSVGWGRKSERWRRRVR